MKLKLALWIGLFITGMTFATIIWWAFAEGPFRNPRDALQDFLTGHDRAEDQLMDPLILCGRRVVPLVIAEIHNKDMHRRRYAIGFLGNGHYSEALSALEKILLDSSEIFYFRADALEAIYQIAPERARELAPKYVSGQDLLGRVAQDIAASRNPVYFTRSYWQALSGRHE
jgi:hypothetical protein